MDPEKEKYLQTVNYTDTPSSLPYPHHIGSIPFQDVDLELFKGQKFDKAHKVLGSKINDVLVELKQLYDEYENTKLIYESKFSFEPIVGKSYYFYRKGEKHFLSLIGPKEWCMYDDFIGEFLLNGDHIWKKV